MISGIILAAGMSTRMGEPKALLDWGGEALVCYQVRQLQDEIARRQGRLSTLYEHWEEAAELN